MANAGTSYLILVPKLQSGWKKNVEDELGTVSGKGGGEKTGDEYSKGFKSKLGGMASALKGAIGAAAVGAAVKEAVAAFGQYEQLVGGVDKLYGEASGKVQKYASEAYKTVGMSANKYMETATQFSASMTASLGGDVSKSAAQTQKAMEVISDNVNVFGSNMEDVTNAFKGFSKQNYTMLDNLKLGYGGTKEEMQRLLDDASKISGVKYDISSLSDLTDAIQVVQTEMGITGTTAKEAAGTVEGSMGMMKSAWENFVTGLGTGGDMGRLTSNLVGSVATFAKNVVPVIGNIANGLLSSIGPMAKQLIGYLTDAVANFDFGAAVAGLVDNLSGAVSGVIDALAVFVDEGMPKLMEKIPSILASVGTAIVRNAPKLLAAVGTMIGSLLKYIVGFGAKIGSAFGSLIKRGVKAVLGFVGDFRAAAGNLIDGLVRGLGRAKDAVVNKIKEIAKGAIDTFKDWLGIKSPSKVMAQMGGYMMQGLTNGIDRGGDGAISAMRGVASSLTAAAVADMPTLVFRSKNGGNAQGGGIVINLNYSKDADANQMVLDIARGLKRYGMIGGVA